MRLVKRGGYWTYGCVDLVACKSSGNRGEKSKAHKYDEMRMETELVLVLGKDRPSAACLSVKQLVPN